MRIGDLIDRLTLTPFPEPAEADPMTVRQTFVPTIEALEVIRRLMSGIAQPAGTTRRPFFFVGRRGVGKTHLLHYMFPLLANPEDPAWDDLEARLQTTRRPRSPLQSCVVQVPEDPAESLEEFLRRKFGWTPDAPAGVGSGLPDVLALDGLSNRIVRLPDTGSLVEDIRTCARLALSCANSGRDLIYVADERLARARRGEPAPPLEALASRCAILWLSPSSIAEVLTATLARKNEKARVPIMTVLGHFRSLLPRFDADEETFLALYPMLPQAFDLMFSMREAFPRFSPVAFAQWAIEQALDRQPEEMITMDHLFESVAPQLRRSIEHRDIVEACERLEQEVMPGLRWDLRTHARPLARALGCAAVTGSPSLSVQQLANWLLVCDSSGTIPGYGFAGKLLEQFEQAGRSRLRCEGEAEHRTYALAIERAKTPPAVAAAPLAAVPRPADPPLPATGQPRPAELPRDAESRSDRGWLERVSAALASPADELPGRVRDLPDAVRTIRVWDRVRPVLGRLEALLPSWNLLQSGDIGPLEAASLFERAFGGSVEEFRQWELRRTELISWLDWLPEYERCRDYLMESFPAALTTVDSARVKLLSAFDRPDLLFGETARKEISGEFDRFKTQYAGYYESIHESTVGTNAGATRTEAAVDAAGLRNLDMLSRLHYVDKKWFHRTRILVQWLKVHRCTLPVRQILETRARCLCGFNPTGSRSLVDSVAELNGLIREGTESIRQFLRKEAAVIIQEVGKLGLDEPVAQQITTLLSQNALLPLSTEAIEKLDSILLKKPALFHTGG